MEWTEDQVTRLRGLWAEGLSTAQIGVRMQLSKNAVVGKAHRLNLVARPSPIIRETNTVSRRNKPRRQRGASLPPLKSIEAAALPAPDFLEQAPVILEPTSAKAPTPVARPPAVAPPVAVKTDAPRRQFIGKQEQCAFPIGEPGRPGFRFCEANAVRGKPYCEDHCGRAFIKLKDRHDQWHDPA